MATTGKGLRYPAGSDSPNVAQYIQNLASDVDTLLPVNAGVSGVIAGTVPPAGTALMNKVFYGNVATNASGDGQIIFPGGAFPNALVAASVTVAVPQSIGWVITTGTSRTVLNIRAYSWVSGAAAASLSITTSMIAWGW